MQLTLKNSPVTWIRHIYSTTLFFNFPLLLLFFVLESQTIEDFGTALHLLGSDVEHLRSLFDAIEHGDMGLLKKIGFKDSEIVDVTFFLENMASTGFLD